MATDQVSERESWRRDASHAVDEILNRVDQLFDAARPDTVFAAPVTAEGRTVISASEVLLIAGVGAGMGGGTGPNQPEPSDDDANGGISSGGGGGGGGGGAVNARPVAVVIIDANGVRVEPVVDVTKIGLAALTVMGAVLVMFGRIRSMQRKLGG
jgi:uncharacterized spore protein YtfJ